MADIRRATLEDVRDIKSLLFQTWHDTFDPLHGAQAVDQICKAWGDDENLISRIEMGNARCLVAIDGSKMLGMAFANGPNDENIAYLSQLYVLKLAQGTGLGKRLLGDIESTFKQAALIRLGVDGANKKAIGFYEHMGYRNSGIMFEREFGGHKFQNLIFEKSLGGSSSSGH